MSTNKEIKYEEQLKRLRFTVIKLAGWTGIDVSELISRGYLKEEDI